MTNAQARVMYCLHSDQEVCSEASVHIWTGMHGMHAWIDCANCDHTLDHMCMYIRTYLADLGLIVCLQQLNKMKMLVVAVVASLIVGTIGQVFPTLEQEACFDAFLQDSNRTEETAAINTNCEGIIDIAARVRKAYPSFQHVL